MKKKLHISSILLLTSLLLFVASAIENDLMCLEGVKKALDPQHQLTWNLHNNSVGAVCQLEGVTCWNERENRIIGLQLPDFQLAGQLPESLKYCRSLQTLDLSDNKLSGSIPPKICYWLPYLVTLDLSRNSLNGSIPPGIVTCKFLNNLYLNGNSLTGSIPYGIGLLDRLKKFSVANNDLSGSVPPDLATWGGKYVQHITGSHLKTSQKFMKNITNCKELDTYDGVTWPKAVTPHIRPCFEGNVKLCSWQRLGKCDGLSSKSLWIIIAAGAIGATGSMVLEFAIWWWLFGKRAKRSKVTRKDESSWIELLISHKLVQVSLFRKPINNIRLYDLIVATNNFEFENIIISTTTGVSYKAVLPDGSALAVKRLNRPVGEKQFRYEMNRLGRLHHPNLVPLLGHCAVEEEKLLIYRHMTGGTLYSQLHGSGFSIDWPTRLRIGLGAARGLAWLHHGCQPPYIHQCISSNVILLDDDFDARVADFGLASSNDSCTSLKGDVYGFGVVLLELVTGQKPLDVVSNADEAFKGNLVDWVNSLVIDGRGEDCIDKSLVGKGHDFEISRFLKVALNCVGSRPEDRQPMYRVYESLKALADKHAWDEEYDEFPLVFGKQERL